jgi:XXXCH domain-containing protein
MATTFKAMRAALDRSVVPEPSLLDSFVADSRKMVSFADTGSPHYPEYTEAVNALERACRKDDLTAVRTAMEKLRGQRRACHKRHK